MSSIWDSDTRSAPPAKPRRSTTGELVSNVQKANPTNPHQIAVAQIDLLNRYREHALEQAKQSFKWALLAAIAGTSMLLLTIVIYLFTHSLSFPILSGIGGVVVETISGLLFYLHAQTSKQLETFSLSLIRTNDYMLANSLCESITDSKSRDAERVEIIQGILHNTRPHPES